MKDEVIAVFSNKQGGDYNVFAYYWQCFAWAATIGFLKCEPLPLTKKIADKPFSLNTMIANGGDNTANALISMCIAKAGTLDILKDPNDAINLINEYLLTHLDIYQHVVLMSHVLQLLLFHSFIATHLQFYLYFHSV